MFTFLKQVSSLILPITVLVLVPLAIEPRFAITADALLVLGVALLAAGLGLLGITISMIIRIGRGTLAPWSPTSKLVVRGVYSYVRNPMITGGLTALLGESLIFRSFPIFMWLVLFFVVNNIYFTVSEEPGLVRRFGEEYLVYKRNVPRWIPRLKPWKPNGVAIMFLLFSTATIRAQTIYWEKAEVSFDDTVYSLAVDSAGDMFSGTYSGKIFRSTTNGAIWSRSDSGLTASPINSLVISHAGDLFAGAGSDGVFRSTNKGVNWIQVNAGLTDTRVQALIISDGGAVFAGSAGNGIYRSSDKGVSWTPIDSGLFDQLIRCFAISPSGDVLVGTFYGGGIFKSTDNGNHWTHFGLMGNYPEALAVNRDDQVFASTICARGIYRSTNHGANWSRVDSDHAGRSLLVNSIGSLFLGTPDRGVLRSTDNGDSWTEINGGLTTSHIYSLVINKDGHIFAGSDHGVFRSVLSTTSVVEIPSAVPRSYALQQNYPNPFNPGTRITFDLPERAMVRLEVYDLAGKLVQTLADGDYPAGMYRTAFIGYNLPSGVYFYRITANRFTGVKKMLILR